METRVNLAVVGAFVVILAGALIAALLWFAGERSYRKSYETYETYMSESVSGLNVNAPVRYRGVEVGRVTRIALAPRNQEQVQLTLAIERDTPIKTDTIAVLRSQGLTGIAFVELSGGRRDSPPLEVQPGQPHPVIQAGPSLMERLDVAGKALMTQFEQTSENVNELLNADNRRAFAQILNDLQVLTHSLAQNSASLNASLAGAARTMQGAERLPAEWLRVGKRIEDSAERFDRMSDTLARTGERVTRLADQLSELSATADKTLQGAQAGARRLTEQGLPELGALVNEMRELTASLRRVSDRLERNPSVLLYGRTAPPRGPGE